MRWTERQLTFLRAQRLGRLAVPNGGGEAPELVTAAYQLRGEQLLVGGMGFDQSPAYQAAQDGSPVAFLVEDRHGALPDRGLLVIANAEPEVGAAVPALRLVVRTARSWGLEAGGSDAQAV